MDAGGSVLPISTPFSWRIKDYCVGVNDALDDVRGEKRVNQKGDVYIAVSKKQYITLRCLPHHRGGKNTD
jgi:hypothetical protein